MAERDYMTPVLLVAGMAGIGYGLYKIYKKPSPGGNVIKGGSKVQLSHKVYHRGPAGDYWCGFGLKPASIYPHPGGNVNPNIDSNMWFGDLYHFGCDYQDKLYSLTIVGVIPATIAPGAYDGLRVVETQLPYGAGYENPWGVNNWDDDIFSVE